MEYQALIKDIASKSDGQEKLTIIVPRYEITDFENRTYRWLYASLMHEEQKCSVKSFIVDILHMHEGLVTMITEVIARAGQVHFYLLPISTGITIHDFILMMPKLVERVKWNIVSAVDNSLLSLFPVDKTRLLEENIPYVYRSMPPDASEALLKHSNDIGMCIVARQNYIAKQIYDSVISNCTLISLIQHLYKVKTQFPEFERLLTIADKGNNLKMVNPERMKLPQYPPLNEHKNAEKMKSNAKIISRAIHFMDEWTTNLMDDYSMLTKMVQDHLYAIDSSMLQTIDDTGKIIRQIYSSYKDIKNGTLVEQMDFAIEIWEKYALQHEKIDVYKKYYKDEFIYSYLHRYLESNLYNMTCALIYKLTQ